MDLYTVAIHEAAHFLSELQEGRKPKYVTVIPNDESLGHVRSGRLLSDSELDRLSFDGTVSHIFTLLCGPVAEHYHQTGEICEEVSEIEGSSSDWEVVVNFLVHWPPNSQIQIYEMAFSRCNTFICENFDRIKKLAEALCDQNTLTYAEAVQIDKESTSL